MPGEFFKKITPDMTKIKGDRKFKFLAKYIGEVHLWRPTRRSLSRAVLLGGIVTWLPIPFQIPLAAFLSTVFRAHIFTASILALITNPLTMGPMYYSAFKLGESILGDVNAPVSEFSLDIIANNASVMWQPLLLGCAIFGAITSLTLYLCIQIYWRRVTLRKWKNRTKRHRISRKPRTTTPS